MRKFIFIIICAVTIILSGCIEVSVSPNNTKKGSAEIKYEQLCEDFIESLKSKDIEKMNALFCDDIKKSHDLSVEIPNMFNFINGYVVSYSDYTQSTREGDSYRQGTCIQHHVNVKFRQIKTDNNKTFQLSFYANLIDVDNPNKVGIEFIRIIDENEREYLVGEYLD